mgnify:CR=1 FL=1
MSIKAKKKPCKGTGKAKGFGCGEMQYKRTYGLGISCGCYKDWLLNTKEGKEKIQRETISAKKKVEKQERKRLNEKKKKITDWKKKLQDEINKIARFIDYKLPCLARDYYPGQMHGGHVFSRGGNSNIRYNLHNIHRQSAQSNKWQNDDPELREGVIREYGDEYLEWLRSLKGSPQVKYSNVEYFEFKTKAAAIARKLEKENNKLDRPRTAKERIDLRNKINEELGIYPEEYTQWTK